jgi:hypothetical protein
VDLKTTILSIMGLNLHLLKRFVKSHFQEEVLVVTRKVRPPAEFNAFTYKALVGSIFENRGLRFESEENDRGKMRVRATMLAGRHFRPRG